MAGVKGRSGTNKGKDKPYAEALRRAIARAESSESAHALDKIAEKHLASAAGGDMQAIKELADRLDGKPAQSLEHSGFISDHEQALDELDEPAGTGDQAQTS